MRALILAAGRGERMGELTRTTPKPLLRVDNHYLIEYAIANVKRAGIHDIVINVFYLAEQIKQALGDGTRYGVNIVYSEECERLEVGGGIVQALPLLGSEPFIIASSDVVSDYSLSSLPRDPEGLAHLVMVSNPAFHPAGDFGLRNQVVDLDVLPALTFANMGVYRPELFAQQKPGFLRWGDIMLPAIKDHRVTGEYYNGLWYNIGTAADLDAINQNVPEFSELK